MLYDTIASKDNNLIKKIVKLSANSSYRKECNKAVIYGWHLIEEAIKYDILESVIILNKNINKYSNLLNTANTPYKIYIANSQIMNKINVLDSAVDIVGVIKINYTEVVKYNEITDCIFLENIQDPGNLGTIMRVAKASGVRALFASSNCVDIYNPKVLRASQGLQFGLDIYVNIDFYDFVRQYNGIIIATTPYTDTSIYTIDLQQPIAWVFGNEGAGLSSNILNEKLHPHLNEKIIKAKIPMPGDAESLNIAMAATVCVFEMMRQRL